MVNHVALAGSIVQAVPAVIAILRTLESVFANQKGVFTNDRDSPAHDLDFFSFLGTSDAVVVISKSFDDFVAAVVLRTFVVEARRIFPVEILELLNVHFDSEAHGRVSEGFEEAPVEARVHARMVQETDFAVIRENALEALRFELVFVAAIEEFIVAVFVPELVVAVNVQKFATLIAAPVEVFSGSGHNFVPAITSHSPSGILQQSQCESGHRVELFGARNHNFISENSSFQVVSFGGSGPFILKRNFRLRGLLTHFLKSRDS